MKARAAHVVWVPPEQGGRQSVPAGPRYVAPARFEGINESGPSGAQWSLVLQRLATPADSADWLAEVQFLAEVAPHDWLTDGAQFELYEGKKRVACGRVIGPVVPQVQVTGAAPAAKVAQ